MAGPKMPTMRKRLIALLIAPTLALGGSLLATSAASASATVCDAWFCAHVEGSGLHVDWVQMSANVNPDTTWHGYFTVGLRDDPETFQTRVYDWNTPAYYLSAHRHYTAKY